MTAEKLPRNGGMVFSVVAPPALHNDLGLAESIEDFAVEQLVAQARVEALDVAVLPGAAPLDVGGLGTDNRDQFLYRLGDELRSVVEPDVSGNALQDARSSARQTPGATDNKSPSLTPIWRIASTRTSTCRSFATISSGL